MIKPIAFFDPHKGFYWAKPTKITAPVTVDVEPLALYTERTWNGLTNDEIKKIIGSDRYSDLIKEVVQIVEAKLKEKNT
jgi:hypothetical protein